MKKQPVVLVLCTLLELLLLSSFTTSYKYYAFEDEKPVVYTYNRFPEVQKGCASFLSSASELKPDDSRGYRLEQELSFFNGDWEQESNEFSPFIPYEDTDMPLESAFPVSPLKLVSFDVNHVSTVHKSKNAVIFQGTMVIGQARNSSLTYDAYHNFYTTSGMSVLKIFFEGVYLENAEGRMVCMLGNTTLPFLIGDADPSGRIRKDSSFSDNKLRLFQDDHILLVLRYPKTFNLTRRSIQGEMRSLNDGGSFKYFDPVHISSQFSKVSKYEFSYGDLKSRTCDPYPYQDDMIEDGVNVFDGSKFCRNLKNFLHGGFNIVPNWKYAGKHVGFHNRIGPFVIEGEHGDLDWSYDSVRMIMQNLLCESDDTNEIEPKNARVAAVFRAFPSSMDPSTAETRNGLSAMTLSAEGTWDSSTGHLCMVGCLGLADSGLDGCSSQISMYFPRSYSIKQRSVILGSISSTVNEEDSYMPILFGVPIRPRDLQYNHPRYSMSFLSYNYSKTELAFAFRERTQPNNLIATIKKSLLTYPALQDTEQLLARLHSLSWEFFVDAYLVPYPPQYARKPEIFIRMEVCSLGPLFGGYTEWLHNDKLLASAQPEGYPEWLHNGKFPVSALPEVPNSAILNVSLSLMFTEAALKWAEKSYKNIPGLYLEGLYDPLQGEMYLIGCRKVKVESNNTEMERGMDCSIEVNIKYPSKTFRWLKNPTVRITITSKRNKDDPLYFTAIRLQTLMIQYDKREEDAVFRKVFDEILRNLLLLVANMIILHQLFHNKKNVNAVPYISLTMLAFQAIGYILPLISHSKILFEPKDLTTQLYNLYGKERLLQVLDYSGKILSLTCLILTAQVSQKVSESRDSPSKPRCVTHERKVVFFTLIMLIFGFLVLLLVRGSPNTYTAVAAELEEFVAFVQNFFLLPQIIGNLFWQTGVNSLTEMYYFGFTLIRISALVYGYIRDPIIDPYSNEADEFRSLGSSSLSKIGHVVALVVMILLAARVHVQQKSHQQKLCSS